MDYDLSIKKEEERRHFANVDKAPDKEFKAEYEDRMTDATELEENLLTEGWREDEALRRALDRSFVELSNIIYTHKSAAKDGWAKAIRPKLENPTGADAKTIFTNNILQKVQPKGNYTPITFPNAGGTSPVLNTVLQKLRAAYEMELQQVHAEQAAKAEKERLAAEEAARKSEEEARIAAEKRSREFKEIEDAAVQRAIDDFADGEGLRSEYSDICLNIEARAKRANIGWTKAKPYYETASRILQHERRTANIKTPNDLTTVTSYVAYWATLKGLEAENNNLNRTALKRAEKHIASLGTTEKDDCRAWALKYIKRMEFIVPMGEDLITFQEASSKLVSDIVKRFENARSAFYSVFTKPNLDDDLARLTNKKDSVNLGTNITARVRFAVENGKNVESVEAYYLCWGIVCHTSLTTSVAKAKEVAPSGIKAILDGAAAHAAENTFKATSAEKEVIEKNQINSTYFAYSILRLFDNDPDFLVNAVDNVFDLAFDDVNAYGEKLTEAKEDFCCICGEPIEGYGNNPEPYMSADEGRCCDACNVRFVIPMRLDMED
jgi:hypothetical protein